MRHGAFVLALLVAGGCKRKHATAEQNPHDAMALVCDAELRAGVAKLQPAERPQAISRWITDHVTNPDVLKIFEQAGALAPAARRKAFAQAARDRGVEVCALAAELDAVGDVPEVRGRGLVPAVGLGAPLVVSETDVTMAGTTITTVVDGMVAPDVPAQLARLLQAQPRMSDAPLPIALAPELPYRTLAQLADGLRKAGVTRIALLAHAGEAVAAPVELADANVMNRGNLRMVVAVTSQHLSLWSASGQEGTAAKPKFEMPIDPAKVELGPLTKALAEIVDRRWPDGKRPADDHRIVVMLGAQVPAGVLLETLAAVRGDGSRELFADTMLAGGLR